MNDLNVGIFKTFENKINMRDISDMNEHIFVFY